MISAEYDYLRDQLLVRRDRLTSAVAAAQENAEPLKHLLHEVDSALERMDAGTYGLCETCHEPIESDRLQADPVVRFCLDHLSARAQRELERDLTLAASVQAALLPRSATRADGWEARYHYQPAGTVSGDYCDLIPCGNGLLFVLADVAGKGLAASMLVMQLHALFHSLSTRLSPLDELVGQVNQLLCQSSLAEHYATLICGYARPSGDVDVVNAGHPPALVLSDGKAGRLDSTGLPVGMFCSSVYALHRFRLGPGDRLLAATDGLFEAWNGSEEYGFDRLTAALTNRRELDSQMLIRACLDDLNSFLAGGRCADDLSVLAIGRVS